jgi:transmembrane sensor
MPDMSEASFMALLDRYVAGECTGTEAELVRDWLSADPANQAMLDDVERFRRVARNRPPASKADAAWQRAVTELGLDASGVQAQSSTPIARKPVTVVERKHGWIWTAIAASIVVAMSSAIIFRTSGHSVAVVPNLQARDFSTGRAQRASIQLPDGSQLTIGPATTVKLAADFGEKSRDLTLVGQAHFTVHHDAAKPFRVHTWNGIAEDLGTEFVVNAYPETHSTQVVVASGKVALDGTALTRGQMGKLDRTGLVTVASNVDLGAYFGWTQGRLSFHDTPVSEAFPTLGRWYDLDMKIAEARLGKLPLTASFKDESLAQVLDVLDLALGLRHELRGRTVIFIAPLSADGK